MSNVNNRYRQTKTERSEGGILRGRKEVGLGEDQED